MFEILVHYIHPVLTFFTLLFFSFFSLWLGGLQKQNQHINIKPGRDLVTCCANAPTSHSFREPFLYFHKRLKGATAELLKNTAI